MRRPGGPTWKPILLAAVLVGAFTGAGVAAIPSASDGTITGCYGNSNGQMRVVDAQSGETCKNNETQLTWNQTGPTGPQGPQGETGART